MRHGAMAANASVDLRSGAPGGDVSGLSTIRQRAEVVPDVQERLIVRSRALARRTASGGSYFASVVPVEKGLPRARRGHRQRGVNDPPETRVGPCAASQRGVVHAPHAVLGAFRAAAQDAAERPASRLSQPLQRHHNEGTCDEDEPASSQHVVAARLTRWCRIAGGTLDPEGCSPTRSPWLADRATRHERKKARSRGH